MSLTSEYLEAKNKKKKKSTGNSLTDDYLAAKEEMANEQEEEDIAPLRDKLPLPTKPIKTTNNGGWFTGGAFSDGYQFGDITKTILGTINDVSENVTQAVADATENLVDTVAYSVGHVGGIFSKDFQEDVGEFIAHDYSKEAGEFVNKNVLTPQGLTAKLILGGDTDANSLLGEKSEGIVQSGSHLAGQAALQMVGVPWWATSAVNSFGGEIEAALNEDATFGEAGLSGAITTGAELLSEKLFSGFKFQGKAITDSMVRKISSKAVRSMAKLGLDVAGEGMEEVFSGVMSALGQKLTYADEKEFNELFSSEDAFDAFIGGAILSAGGGAVQNVQSHKAGKDYVSGLSANEEKVVNKVFEQELKNEEQKKGRKLNTFEKDKLYDEIVDDLKKGRISTDTIEEVLGGKDYKAYKDTVDSEDALRKEFDELGKKTNPTLADQSRYTELKQQLADIEQNSKRGELKNTLSKNVYDSIRQINKFGNRADSGLLESYNERARRGQAFDADLSKYDAKQQKVIKSAIDSGILNNTNRTHEFVDLVAKISADKGVPFDFTNNQKLKDSGFAIDGKQVNGFVTKDGVTLNIDSRKSLNRVVGHEISHVLEGTELYTELSKAITEYAKSKGDYQGRYDTLTKLYEGVKDANIDAELTADLIGDYLFTDEDFINNLSTKHRNVFQKIYDEIKYLSKVATAGSKEARELERVKKAFEKAYKESGKASENTKYSMSDSNIKDVSTGYASGESYYTMSYTQDGKVVGTLEYGEYDGAPNVKMIEVDPEYRRKGIATKLLQELQNKYPDTEIDFGMSTPDGTKLLDAITYDVTDEAIVADRQKLKDLQTELNDLQEKLDVLYDTENLTEAQDKELHDLGDRWQEVYEAIHDLEQSLRGKRATKTFVKTDTKYSLSDSDGKQLSKEQSEYFKDSKMRDENGNLKVMYHGSQDAGFHVFDPSMSDDGISLFFVDRNDVAASYSGTSETYEAKTVNTAEDVNNFIESIGVEGYEVVENNGKFTLLYEGDRVADSTTAKGIYEEFCWYEGVGEGDANYKVYLNLTNPLEIDAKGRPWNKIDAEFSQEVYDRYNSLTAEEKEALVDLAEWEDFRLFNSEIQEARGDALASAYAKMGDDCNIYDLFSVAADNFSEDSMRENARYYLKTRDMAQRAKEGGYDGVIIKNVHDNGGYSNGSEGASTVAIAFNSEQVKSVANDSPTGDPDIRFSLSEAVEETKDLLVLHNLSESKLLKQLDLDGFPMPSLAVTNQPHTNFGSISILFDKDTIDPKKNKKNKTYSADAWTPTFPRIEYEANRDVSNTFDETVRGLVDDSYYSDSLNSFLYDAEDSLNRNGGYEGYIDNLAEKPAIQYAFLKSKGENIEIAQKAKAIELGFSTDERWISRYEGLIKDFDGDISGLNKIPYTELVEQSPTLKNLLDKYPLRDPMQQLRLIGRVINGAEAYQNYDPNAEVATEYIPDYSQTNKDMLSRIDTNELKAWLKEQTNGIVANSGVYNGKEIFTPNGNRRSFQQLHYPVTVENIVKSMASQGEKSVTSFHGVKTLRATTAKTFKSIAEIQKAKGKLQNLSEAEVNQIHDELSDQMYKVFNKIIEENPKMFRKDDIFALDTIGEVLSEVEYENINASYIKGVFNKYGYNLSTETADDCFKLLDAISSMPVYIFEAKPQRVVGYDEIKAVVIPENTSIELKNALTQRGISFVEYDGTEADRQAKLNEVATANDSYFSLSAEGETERRFGSYDVRGEDLRFDAPVTPENVQKGVQNTTENVQNTENVAPMDDADAQAYNEAFPPMEHSSTYEQDIEAIQAEMQDINDQYIDLLEAGKEDEAYALIGRIDELIEKGRELDTKARGLRAQEDVDREGYLNSLDDTDVPAEMDAPYYTEREPVTLGDKTLQNVTKKASDALFGLDKEDSAKMAQIVQKYAKGDITADELFDEVKREFQYSEEISNNEDILNSAKKHIRKTKIFVPPRLKAEFNGKYNDGFNAFRKEHFGHFTIVTDPTKSALKIDQLYGELNELFPGLFSDEILNEADQLQEIADICTAAPTVDYNVSPYDDGTIQEVVDVINNGVNEYLQNETLKRLDQDREAFYESVNVKEDIAPTFDSTSKAQIKGQQTMFEDAPIAEAPIKAETKTEAPTEEPKIAKVLESTPKEQKKAKVWQKFRTYGLDKHSAVEDLSLQTGNRELMAKADFLHRSEAVAQRYIAEHLDPIRKKYEATGDRNAYETYSNHLHNIDRMSLESKAQARLSELEAKFGPLMEDQIKAIAATEITDKTTERTANTIREAREWLDLLEVKNKPVFDDSVTADKSREFVKKFEAEHADAKKIADELVEYNKGLRQILVDGGLVSQETADLWGEMYPHYVPISRDGKNGLAVNVALDSKRTGVDAPIRRATGGNSDMKSLLDVEGVRTIQTFRAIARNDLGLELMHTLNSVVETKPATVGEMLDTFESETDELLKKGENGENPTFTVFENGKRITFEITEELYDALKPRSEWSQMEIPGLSHATKFQRGILTQFNPIFTLTNLPKDVGDVLVNSQHPIKTYAELPNAFKELTNAARGKEGKWIKEYYDNGGFGKTPFDSKKQIFEKKSGAEKVLGFVPEKISNANEFIETAPRLAEYIASRKNGASIKVAMLDAARVTTNFAAGGEVTKFFNNNGATFLNASVEGFNQQVRNVREAKAKGLKGVMQLAAKYAVAGIPIMILNHLLWDDDEDYEELSDYVKDNYYIVAKTEDGKFIRIPKGRAVAVIQNAFEQMKNLVTGDDEVDMARFGQLLVTNLAPNDPVENNVLAPILQAINNKTWYGGDLVPQRLQDMPTAEQYDETTDSISKWLGEKTGLSPYKINYVLDQYSGGIGDSLLPYFTPESDGNILAPFADKFTTDSTMKNQYVSDFYDTVDELVKNSNSMNATEEDALKSKYMNSISSEIGELYAEKREIQNSNLSDKAKDAAVREIQRQIDDLAKESLDKYSTIDYQTARDGEYANIGNRYFKKNDKGEWVKLDDDAVTKYKVTSAVGDAPYATDGENHFRWYEPSEDAGEDAEAGWRRITDKELERQNEVTSGLRITPEEYWGNKEEYSYAYDYPGKYAVSKAVGGYKAYKSYSSELYDIKADKDEDGKSISGSRKEKVIDWINNLDADYGTKIILFKSEYNADDTYNYEIIDYLNSRDDISYSDMETILKELGFTVDSEGNIYWD